MIELPEAMSLARQFNEEVCGKRVVRAVCCQTPHKFAFVSRPLAEYARILPGKRMGQARAVGAWVLVDADPGYLLVFGGGGERIRLHGAADTLPKKHQLLLEFEAGEYLTVSIQGWGSVKLLEKATEMDQVGCGAVRAVSDPLSEEFTFAAFETLCEAIPADDARSVKYFLITAPGILGLGNGYTQDILLEARLHPRIRVASLDGKQRRALHRAIVKVLKEAVKKGGRDDEFGLHDQPGKYRRLLSAEANGKPCPKCGATITKFAFLGGACYVCPECQPEPAKTEK